MQKYVVFMFILLVFFNTYSQESSEIGNMKSITPKDYFTIYNVSYYFGYDGIKSIKIDNDSLIIDDVAVFSNQGYGYVSLTRFLSGTIEVLYADDGSLVIYRTNYDYSCQNSVGNNCLYAPVYIRKIIKKSLSGNISLYRIDKSIPLEEKDIIDFPIGSNLYSIVVEVPSYDLSSFTDIESLVCSKNEDNLCRGVINNGMIDKTALFELSSIKEKNKEFLFSYSADGLIYNYDLLNNEVIPYNKICVQSAVNIDDLQGCVESSMPNGIIKQHKHPKGIIYWEIDYKNPSVDNVYFWVNNKGEPFKAYTNSRLIYNFSLFNKDAADAISKLFIVNK